MLMIISMIENNRCVPYDLPALHIIKRKIGISEIHVLILTIMIKVELTAVTRKDKPSLAKKENKKS